MAGINTPLKIAPVTLTGRFVRLEPLAREHVEVVGSTRFLNISARDGRMEIGATVVAPAYQRSVVNTEGKLLMLTHACEALGATRVELKTHKNDEKSRRAIERIGAQFEGIHRTHMLLHDGTRRDTAWYSILDDEWPSIKHRLESIVNDERR